MEIEKMATGSLIKRTTSVCPTCLKLLRAEVVEISGKVFIQRTCPQHGPFQNLVEKDVSFYRAAANITKKRFCNDHDLTIPITSRCNLKCRFCLHADNKDADLPAEKIIEIAKNSAMGIISLSGGEPTLHPQLIEIIEKLRGLGKEVVLLTNGIMLEDPGYVRALKEAGVSNVLFSLHGFSDAILTQIDGRSCLREKLAALENLKKERISVMFSLSILRGVNEGELKKALDFCLRNTDFIFMLRVRSFSRIGRYEDTETLTTGELVELLAEALGVKKERLTESVARRKISSAIQYNTVLCFSPGPEKFEFLYEKQYPLPSLYPDTKPYSISRLIQKPVNRLLDALIRMGGNKRLFLNMWSWPDRYNLDLDEICSSGILFLNSKFEAHNSYNTLILGGVDVSAGPEGSPAGRIIINNEAQLP